MQTFLSLDEFAAQGRDVRLSEDRVAGYRNFATKLWNATRFCEMNDCLPQAGFDPGSVKATQNKCNPSQYKPGETCRGTHREKETHFVLAVEECSLFHDDNGWYIGYR